MKKILVATLLVSILLTFSLFSYGTDELNNGETTETFKSLSLEEAIEEGIKNSVRIKISDLDIEVKKTELQEARGFERQYEEAGISLGTVEGFQLEANMLSTSARFALEEEKLKKEYLKEDIKHNVMLAYYGALQATDYVNITKNSLKNIQRNKDIIDKKFELGLVSKSDVLMTEIALNEANINMEKAKEDMRKALRALNMILNYPLDTELELTSDFKQETFAADLNEDLEKAYETRFDMIQTQHNYELVKLDFETNAYMYTPNTYKYRYKNSNLLKMENILKSSKQNVEFDIRNKYDAINSAYRQIKLAEANVAKAEEGLRIVEQTYDVGMATIQDVRETIIHLYGAELALSGAISNYNLAILEYNKAV
ncbi:MAG TPA: TolC family protein, partial [Clostridia bacterium]|nr:TolC family protein [Clostridia bacterium]